MEGENVDGMADGGFEFVFDAGECVNTDICQSLLGGRLGFEFVFDAGECVNTYICQSLLVMVVRW